MPNYVQQEVRELCEEGDGEETVTLLLGVEGAMAPVRERIKELGGTVDEELPFDTLRVDLPEESISDLCEDDRLTSIEIEEEGETLSPEYFRSR